jgi:hypothetical protein
MSPPAAVPDETFEPEPRVVQQLTVAGGTVRRALLEAQRCARHPWIAATDTSFGPFYMGTPPGEISECCAVVTTATRPVRVHPLGRYISISLLAHWETDRRSDRARVT